MPVPMKPALLAVLLAPLVLSSTANAGKFYPYSCEWISEVTPDAVIRFNKTNGTGSYVGGIFYKGKRLMDFREGQSMGWGSLWWGTGLDDGGPRQVIIFRGNQVVRGTPGKPAPGPQRVLIVGLGSSLWYGRDSNWRSEGTLLTAAEGFWRTSPKCRTLHRK